ncbi:MAG: segregation/condensation protein A [Planctomycetaceae bacterium]
MDLDEIGEFVLMASTLTEIKSREVLPQIADTEQPAEEERPLDAENPRSELIHRLLEHKKFRDAASSSKSRAAPVAGALTRDSPTTARPPARTTPPIASRTSSSGTSSAPSAASRAQGRRGRNPHPLRRNADPRLRRADRRPDPRAARLPFSSLLEPESQRSKVVGMFLAILELLRHHSFRARCKRRTLARSRSIRRKPCRNCKFAASPQLAIF